MSTDENQPSEDAGSKSGSGPSRAGGFYPGGDKRGAGAGPKGGGARSKGTGAGPQGAGAGSKGAGGSGSSGGAKKRRGGNRSGGPRPTGAGGDTKRGSGPQGGDRRRGSGGDRRHSGTPPMEIAVRSSRNALKRHAESLRDDQSRLACRGVVTAFIGSCKGSSSPGEVLSVVEQVVHVIEVGRRDDTQLPLALRSVVNFALEVPRRQRDVAEMLRLLLRHSYVLAADHIPRQLRDDGSFRATALLAMFEDCAPEYLADQKFRALSG